MREELHLAGRLFAPDLGQREGGAIFVHRRLNPLDEFGQVGVALVVDMVLIIERPRALGRMGDRRIVGQRRVVHREIERVEPEAVDPARLPKARDIEQRVLHLDVVRVELRLLLQEAVVVILLAPRVPGP